MHQSGTSVRLVLRRVGPLPRQRALGKPTRQNFERSTLLNCVSGQLSVPLDVPINRYLTIREHDSNILVAGLREDLCVMGCLIPSHSIAQ